jgi:hypothetical protein
LQTSASLLDRAPWRAIAAAIDQLIAEPEANNHWTRKSRFKLLAL